MSSLYIPIKINAFVVNEKVRKFKGFRRFRMNYYKLDHQLSPEPDPFGGSESDFYRYEKNEGVYLHWQLPEGFRHGYQTTGSDQAAAGNVQPSDSEPGDIKFPYIPNRWLVIRSCEVEGETRLKRWLVYSDYLHPENIPTYSQSPYLHPETGKPTFIGWKGDLDREDFDLPDDAGKTKDPFLTAVGPGDATFLAYEPNVENVVALHDDLNDLTAKALYKANLRYHIAGWYHDEQFDLLQNQEAYAHVLNFKTWEQAYLEKPESLAPEEPKDITAKKQALFFDLLKFELEKDFQKDSAPTQSVCFGSIFNVSWNKVGDIPIDPVDTSKIHLSVGMNSIDAFLAMTKAQMEQSKSTGEGKKAIEQTLQTIAYDIAAETDSESFVDLLHEKEQELQFGLESGGIQWELEELDHAGDEEAIIVGFNNHEDAVEFLNSIRRKQQLINRKRWLYQDRAQQLRGLQWKSLRVLDINEEFGALPDGFREQEHSRQLDELASALKTLKNDITELQASLAGSVEANLGKTGRKRTYQLKQVTSDPFAVPNEPLVMLSGARHPEKISDDLTVPCRFPAQLIDEPIAGLFGADLPKSEIPDFVMPWLKEAEYLDREHETILRDRSSLTQKLTATHKGFEQFTDGANTFPQIWQQPWTPLYFECQVRFYPVPFEDHWEFDSYGFKRRYHQHESDLQSSFSVFSRTFLTQQHHQHFADSLKKYLKEQKGLNDDQVKQQLHKLDNWDFISQRITGFNDFLKLQDDRLHRIPEDKHQIIDETLVNDGNLLLPLPDGSHFNPLQQGYFCFERITLTGSFGQSLDILNPQRSKAFVPIKSDYLIPTGEWSQLPMRHYMELKPRLLKPYQLSLDWISHSRKGSNPKPHQDHFSQLDVIREHELEGYNLSRSVNPVCGWIMTNYLDKSFSVYDQAGLLLGEFRNVPQPGGKMKPDFVPFQNRYQDIRALKEDEKTHHLGQTLGFLQNLNDKEFLAYTQLIDNTLWSCDPALQETESDLAVLVGRPLAICRLGITLEEQGMPLQDPRWKSGGLDQTPDYLRYQLPVKLGLLASHGDGLIGYFDNEYLNFHAQINQDSGIKTIKSIPTGQYGHYENIRGDGTPVYYTMLMDPLGSLHAFSGILPVKHIRVPGEFIRDPMKNMEVVFRNGPLLSPRGQKDEDGVPVPFLQTPVPSHFEGEWKWISPIIDDQGFRMSDEEIALESPTSEARFDGLQKIIREGFTTFKRSS